jgi:hypothetical protein
MTSIRIAIKGASFLFEKTDKSGRRGKWREFYKIGIVRSFAANTVSIGGEMHRVRLSAFIYKGELFGFRSEKLSFL